MTLLLYCRYYCNYQSEPILQLRVQTSEPRKKNNEPNKRRVLRTPAIHALRESCVTLSELCDFLLQQLEKELPQVKQDRIQIDLYREQY